MLRTALLALLFATLGCTLLLHTHFTCASPLPTENVATPDATPDVPETVPELTDAAANATAEVVEAIEAPVAPEEVDPGTDAAVEPVVLALDEAHVTTADDATNSTEPETVPSLAAADTAAAAAEAAAPAATAEEVAELVPESPATADAVEAESPTTALADEVSDLKEPEELPTVDVVDDTNSTSSSDTDSSPAVDEAVDVADDISISSADISMSTVDETVEATDEATDAVPEIVAAEEDAVDAETDADLYRGFGSGMIKDNMVRALGAMLNNVKNAKGAAKSKLMCSGCVSAISITRWIHKRNLPHSIYGQIMEDACIKFSSQTERVCKGLVETFKDEAVQVLIGSQHVGAHDVCHTLFNLCHGSTSERLNWEVDIPRQISSSDAAALDKLNGSNAVANSSLPKTLRMLHLTDVHIDPLYKVGSSAQCGEPLCCRQSTGDPNAARAGYWGTPGVCDTPMYFFEAMLEHIAATDKVDFVIYTGDSVPHDIWDESQTYTLNLTGEVNHAIRNHFPNLSTFATLGNHDSYPLNAFQVPSNEFVVKELGQSHNSKMQWLYDVVAKEWIGWGPDESQRENIRRGAFYAHRPYPGLKIISLNTNYCAKLNWWILLDMVDPANELNWLVNQLTNSEKTKEAVYIISHISPTAQRCTQAWRDNYFKIMARFRHTVRGTFFGHSHFDEYSVTYDPADLSQPTSVAYIAPSITAYRHVNPGYRIYTLNTDTFELDDYETYIVDLNEANMIFKNRGENVGRKEDLAWNLEYTARKDYGLKDLSAQSWSTLTNRMHNDEALFKSYYRNLYKSESFWMNQRCDDDCRKDLLCNARANACHDKDQELKLFRLIDDGRDDDAAPASSTEREQSSIIEKLNF